MVLCAADRPTLGDDHLIALARLALFVVNMQDTAAIEILNVTVKGVAGHGALPHQAADPIIAASSIIMALQTVISRNNDALDPAVLTLTERRAGQFRVGGRRKWMRATI